MKRMIVETLERRVIRILGYCLMAYCEKTHPPILFSDNFGIYKLWRRQELPSPGH